jgi:hypothetical protein
MNTKALCALCLPVIAVGGLALWPQPGMVGATFESPSLSRAALVGITAAAAMATQGKIADATAPVQTLDLQSAVESGSIQAAFTGNGREMMRATLVNASDLAVNIKAEAGQMFEAGKNAVVVVRAAERQLAPGEQAELLLQTAATRSTNVVASAPYQLSTSQPPRIAALLAYVQEHMELSPGAVQTAVLALTENLPLNAVAKFTPATNDLKSRFNTDSFRVNTFDIVTGLTALREIGVPESSIAMTIDPQLKIEAMIEPVTRAAAMRYYGLTAATEWEFWKHELLSGDASTRHYALYGIARFYPEVALEMLPRWAREGKTSHVYRLSAVQALAETQRPEALPLLNKLAMELGTASDLGKAAVAAAQYLEARLDQLAMSKNTVAFRASSEVARF